MAHFNKFPTDFPLDEVRLIYSYVRDANHGGHDLREVAGAATWVALYGIGQMPDQHDPVPMGATGDSLESFAVAVEPFVVMQAAGGPPEAFPWALVLPIALELIKLFLDRRK